MVWHVLAAIVLVAYFEITGQFILYKLNRNTFPIATGVGLMALFAYGYITTSILTFLNVEFVTLFNIFAGYIIISSLLVLIHIKKINWHFDYKNWLVAIIFVLIMLYYAWNTTLGNLDGFDSVYYLNLISTNTVAKKINTIDLYWGYEGGWMSPAYKFQSYYYFASCITYICTWLLGKVTVANNLSVIVWVLQTLYNFFFASLLINSCDYIAKGKKLFKYTMLFVFLFFFGKLYFNNVFGFFGNSFILISISYACIFIMWIYKSHNWRDWILLFLSVYSSCSFSSTGLFTIIFMLFGAYFILADKDDRLFIYYAFLLIMPLINLFEVVFEFGIKTDVIYSSIVCFALIVLSIPLAKLSKFKVVRALVLLATFGAMFYMSYKTTNNIFDFSAFFNNRSETADMTINYFNWYSSYGAGGYVYRIFIWLLLAYACLIEFKNPFVIMCLALIIGIFNPFCCSYLNKINIVYYRAYDIIINPFSIILFTNLALERFNNKYFYYGFMTLILIAFGVTTDFINPSYYHESFKPEDNYNNLMKMDADLFNAINYVKNELEYNNKETSYIVCENVLMESIVPKSRYVYCRGFMPGYSNEAEAQVFSMFYPMDVWGNSTYEEVPADYDNMGKYIKESGIEYLIIDLNKEYYDKTTGVYGYLHFKVAECGVGFSCYHNDNYEVYYFGDVG